MLYTSKRNNSVSSRPPSAGSRPVKIISSFYHPKRVRQELEALGVSRYGRWRAESRYLPEIIHPDEHLGGVVYGHHADGFAMLVATDRRVIFLDKKPLFVNEDEITYDVISGVNYSHTGVSSTVVLHSRIRDYKIRTFNNRAAHRFVKYIEQRCLEHSEQEERHDYTGKKWAV